MARREAEEGFDRELEALPEGLRWREWMRRVEAVLFASAAAVAREDLARVVGRGASLDLLIEDLRAELADRPYEIRAVGGAWALRTRPAYAPVIHAAADLGDRPPPMGEGELAVLAAIAWRQPITRAELRTVLGAEIGREVIARLRARNLIALGPRSPRPGAPQTFVTTETFLDVFGLASLQDLAEMEAFDGDWGEGSGAAALP
jgi:segregation and condensation protein B